MNAKKLIGTIIGVTAFAALIAGATFAWLTLTPTFTNNTVTGGTTNFIVNYSGGNQIRNVPILDSATVTTAGFSEGNGFATVKAYRNTNNADGDLTIKLITNSDNAIVNSTTPVLKYAVCNGACTLTGTAPASVTSSTTGLLAKGNITTTDQSLVTIDGIPTTQTSYTIYLWLEQSELYGTNSANYIGKEYSGYISANAIQD